MVITCDPLEVCGCPLPVFVLFIFLFFISHKSPCLSSALCLSWMYEELLRSVCVFDWGWGRAERQLSRGFSGVGEFIFVLKCNHRETVVLLLWFTALFSLMPLLTFIHSLALSLSLSLSVLLIELGKRDQLWMVCLTSGTPKSSLLYLGDATAECCVPEARSCWLALGILITLLFN